MNGYSPSTIARNSDLIEKIENADATELTRLEPLISEDSWPPALSVSLLVQAAQKYRELNESESAVKLADKALSHPAFGAAKIDDELAVEWRRAAFVRFACLDADARVEMISQVSETLASTSSSAFLRLQMLGFLVEAQAKLLNTEEARQTVDLHLETILADLQHPPSALTINRAWSIDKDLESARIPSNVRLGLLEWCAAASEDAINANEDFDGQHFPNLVNIRSTLARLYSDLGRSSDSIRSVASIDEPLFARFKQRLVSMELTQVQRSSALDRMDKWLADRSQGIEALASKAAEFPFGNSPLIGKRMPRLDSGVPIADSFNMPDDSVVLLEFWAVWCGPCIKSFPDVQELATKHAGDKFVVVGVTKRYGYYLDGDQEGLLQRATAQRQVSVEEEAAAIRHFAAEQKLAFPMILDDGTISEAFRVESLPTTVVVDSSGIIRFVGSVSSMAQYERIDQLIGDLLSTKAE